MGEVINLRRARKVKARASAATEAAANRALHGRTKAERARDEQQEARKAATLDGARREES